MVKNTVVLLLIAILLGLGNTHLVRVELNEERLTPLADNGLKIIGEL